jgi:hypothetical protein
MENQTPVSTVSARDRFINRVNAHTLAINSTSEARVMQIRQLQLRVQKQSIGIERNRLRLDSCRQRQAAAALLRRCRYLEQPDPTLQAAEITRLKQRAEYLLSQAFDLEFEACRLDTSF